MLRRLSVENYALIDKLEMELDPHLNIITGETGAGKSILLGALGLLLGAKNDGQAMKDATRNCTVEGTFEITGSGLEAFFDENDLDYAPETTLTRMITPAGKSRAFVNDVPVQLAQLRELGTRLLDIHSQHQNLILSSEEFRTSALDTVAANGELLAQYAAQYARLTELRRQLATLREEAAKGRRDEEWLRFQTEELTAADLRPGEQAELEEELTVLENADRIGEALTSLRNALDTDESGVLAQLKNSENELNHIRSHYPAAGEYAERLRSVLEELKDINGSAAAACERLDADPERLAKCSARLDTLIALQQKHRAADEVGLIALRDSCVAQLAAIVHSDEEIARAEAALAEASAKTAALADRLHKAREKAASGFEKHILATLARLGMAETVFRIALLPLAEPGRTGRDSVQFLFTANPRMTPQPVERIASGGELSRVMLALKALLAERMQLPTIIFDEIDTGVSGRIADAMGEIIASLSGSIQVVDITHLPQVASKGTAHFVVYKRGGRTDITRLNDEERVTEIAKMLSGSEITDAALAQARILLGK
ncbi:DNA repair protein RecN [Alistipes sp.]|uniref:DNA repair protein RecN n=1 Tax=Alistipes sp. TaxID=1872444 RepID=UPI0025C0435F|nr:DNA repair protein RecN [Alistipes sp.]